MDRYQLSIMWSELEKLSVGDDYRYLRFADESCVSDVYVALGPNDERALILRTNANGVTPEDKRKLSIRYDFKLQAVVLSLLDSGYQDLFDDLVMSLFSVIKDIESKTEATDCFIRHFRKWASFFDVDEKQSLSDEVVLGLIGELRVLNELMSKARESEINSVLEGWRGPYDESKDFVLIDRDVEVKTISKRAREVSIQSLQQLTEQPGKDLHLLVQRVKLSYEGGLSLDAMFRDTCTFVIEKGGDVSILYEAVHQKGLNRINMKDYSHLRYKFEKEELYDVLKPGFPKIDEAHKASGFTRASYGLSLGELSPYLIMEKHF